MDVTTTAQVIDHISTVNTGDPLTLITGAVASGKIIQMILARYIMPYANSKPKLKAALPLVISTVSAAIASWKGGMPVQSAIFGALIATASAHLINNSSLATPQATIPASPALTMSQATDAAKGESK